MFQRVVFIAVSFNTAIQLKLGSFPLKSRHYIIKVIREEKVSRVLLLINHEDDDEENDAYFEEGALLAVHSFLGCCCDSLDWASCPIFLSASYICSSILRCDLWMRPSRPLTYLLKESLSGSSAWGSEATNNYTNFSRRSFDTCLLKYMQLDINLYRSLKLMLVCSSKN